MWSAGALTFRSPVKDPPSIPVTRTFEALTLFRFAGGRCASRGSIGHRKDGKMPAVHAHVFGVFSTRAWKLPFYPSPFFFVSVRAGARSGYPS